MGIILFPFLIIHLTIFILSLYWHFTYIHNLKNILIYSPLSAAICFFGSNIYLKYIFFTYQNKSVSFDIIFDIVLGKITIIIFLINLLAYIFLRKKIHTFYHAILTATLSIPPTTIVLSFVHGMEYMKKYKERIGTGK